MIKALTLRDMGTLHSRRGTCQIKKRPFFPRVPLATAAVFVVIFVVGSLFGAHPARAMINDSPAITVLGQTDDNNCTPGPVFTKGAVNDVPNRLGMSSPTASTIDTVNHRLFVSDNANQRVLVYSLASDNSLPDLVPDFVLGQSNFYANTAATTQAYLSFLLAPAKAMPPAALVKFSS